MEFKLEVFAPEDCIQDIQKALNDIGVGIVGDYDYVFVMSKINGCWRPSKNANPFSGETGKINFGEEIRLETRCPRELVSQSIALIKQHHPYEEPVINIIPLANHEFL